MEDWNMHPERGWQQEVQWNQMTDSGYDEHQRYHDVDPFSNAEEWWQRKANPGNNGGGQGKPSQKTTSNGVATGRKPWSGRAQRQHKWSKE